MANQVKNVFILGGMSELWQRIRAARKHAKLSQEQLGAICDPTVSKAGVGLWEASDPKKRTKPKYENLAAISKATGAPLEWLLSNENDLSPEWMRKIREPSNLKSADAQAPVYVEDIGTPIHAWDDLAELDPEHYVGVPRYDVHVSAGNGTVVYEVPEKEKPQSFRIEWLQRNGWNEKDLMCIKAAGDSMSPTITDGADLLVNREDTTIRDGRVYVIRFGSEVRVKRLYLRPDNGIIVHSDNPAYERIDVPAEQMQYITIIGRVVWQAGML